MYPGYLVTSDLCRNSDFSFCPVWYTMSLVKQDRRYWRGLGEKGSVGRPSSISLGPSPISLGSYGPDTDCDFVFGEEHERAYRC